MTNWTTVLPSLNYLTWQIINQKQLNGRSRESQYYYWLFAHMVYRHVDQRWTLKCLELSLMAQLLDNHGNDIFGSWSLCCGIEISPDQTQDVQSIHLSVLGLKTKCNDCWPDDAWPYTPSNQEFMDVCRSLCTFVILMHVICQCHHCLAASVNSNTLWIQRWHKSHMV